jgi:DNA-binding transcriptional LysR family regulator
LAATCIEAADWRVKNLTSDAGQIFLIDAKRTIADVEQAIERVQRFASGRSGRLRVAISAALSAHRVVTAAIRTFRSEQPDIELTLETIESVSRPRPNAAHRPGGQQRRHSGSCLGRYGHRRHQRGDGISRLPSGIVFLPIAGLAMATLFDLLWRSDNLSPALGHLVETIRSAAARSVREAAPR